MGIFFENPFIAFACAQVEHKHLFFQVLDVADHSHVHEFVHFGGRFVAQRTEHLFGNVANFRFGHELGEDLVLQFDARFDQIVRRKRESIIVFASVLDIISACRSTMDVDHVLQNFVSAIQYVAFFKRSPFQVGSQILLVGFRKVENGADVAKHF